MTLNQTIEVIDVNDWLDITTDEDDRSWFEGDAWSCDPDYVIAPSGQSQAFETRSKDGIDYAVVQDIDLLETEGVKAVESFMGTLSETGHGGPYRAKRSTAIPINEEITSQGRPWFEACQQWARDHNCWVIAYRGGCGYVYLLTAIQD